MRRAAVADVVGVGLLVAAAPDRLDAEALIEFHPSLAIFGVAGGNHLLPRDHLAQRAEFILGALEAGAFGKPCNLVAEILMPLFQLLGRIASREGLDDPRHREAVPVRQLRQFLHLGQIRRLLELALRRDARNQFSILELDSGVWRIREGRQRQQ